MFTPEIRAMKTSLPQGFLALPLLVTGIGTDHQHPPVAADDLALLAHRLDRPSYLHADSLSEFADIKILDPRPGSGDRFRSPLPRRRGTRSVKRTRCRRTGGS